ncbi:MAG: hypothetical protein J6M63_11020 [Pseudobutyrivibrio sp.]|nr:hypothetical protein [Pseudobutyrivibrio sp.]MBP3622050.1 hypothetical protein [Lachnospiraceae bacterium]
MPISQDYIESLSKQVFIVEYLLNGMFPCQSDVVRLIRSKKREWKFNDKFEYRMLLAGTNTGGTLNSQVFHENVGLIKPNALEYGTFRATYGTVTDGFDIDMMANLETKEKRAAFETHYGTMMHATRMNVAALFKNFAIHGQFGVIHQLSAPFLDGTTYRGGTSPVHNDNVVHAATGITYCPNTFSAADIAGTGATRTPFRIKAPINVYNSNFKQGRYIIKTKEVKPWGAADVSEMYLILENQPGYLTLLSVGTTVSDWEEGQFLEVTGNREVAANSAIFDTSWSLSAITVADGPYAGKYDMFNYSGDAKYTNGNDAMVGAPEGLADLFPWYTDPNAPETRLGLDLSFRDQPNRLRYSTEQAGGFIVQQQNEHIIDAIMRGAFMTKSSVPYADIGIWMNPVTRIEMGYEEGENVKVIRDNFVEGPIVYQRGIKTTEYQIGNQVVKEVVEDLNMPTDVIVIGPKNDIAYNCWDNATFEIDQYIQETWGKSKPPAIKDLSIPKDVITKLDLSQRITYGSPTLRDGGMASFSTGNRIRHPQNKVPVAMHEMGALFTEYPYCYTIVKLRRPIFDITTV